MVDKNAIMVKYLLQCPFLKEFSTFFNFGVASDNNKQFITQSSDKNTDKSYVDGSEQKVYSISIIDFKSVGYNAIIESEEEKDENLTEMLEVQKIIDWIEEQEALHNYPDFGTDTLIEKISATNSNPNIDGIDTSVTPALALYSVTINVTYIDSSKVLWK